MWLIDRSLSDSSVDISPFTSTPQRSPSIGCPHAFTPSYEPLPYSELAAFYEEHLGSEDAIYATYLVSGYTSESIRKTGIDAEDNSQPAASGSTSSSSDEVTSHLQILVHDKDLECLLFIYISYPRVNRQSLPADSIKITVYARDIHSYIQSLAFKAYRSSCSIVYSLMTCSPSDCD